MPVWRRRRRINRGYARRFCAKRGFDPLLASRECWGCSGPSSLRREERPRQLSGGERPRDRGFDGVFYHKIWVERKAPAVALRAAQLWIFNNPDRIPELAAARGLDFGRVREANRGRQKLLSAASIPMVLL